MPTGVQGDENVSTSILKGTQSDIELAFRKLFQNTFNASNMGNVHPNTYRNRFNKLLDDGSNNGKFLCRNTMDSTKWKMKNGEYDVDCTGTWYKLMTETRNSDFSNPTTFKDGVPRVVADFKDALEKLEQFKRELLGAGGGGGQLAKQSNKILKGDVNLTKSQNDLLTKLDELNNFKKDHAGDVKDVTYIGKSKKQLELAYYVGGIGIMLLFIFKAMNNNQ